MGKPELTQEQKDAKARLQAQVDAAEKKADTENKSRSGKGTRVTVGMTRGRNPQVISYEEFDESKPETLPSNYAEFAEITKINDEKTIVSLLIDGFNSAAYTNASDPVAEFVEPTWSEEVQKQFRTAVRNYAQACGVSIEDAVAIIKPGVVKSQQKA